MATVQMRNTRAMKRALANMGPELELEVIKVLKKTGINLRSQIVRNYHRGPATGTTYQKYNPRRVHTASAPGQAPQSDTGRLANSVLYDMPTHLTVEVYTMVEYGYWLEFGTSTILSRPNWIPTVEEYRPQYVKDIEAAIKRAMS